MPGGEVSASITAPFAVDSQGTEVPATLAVDGGRLVVSVEHRDLDVAYPLFVDPEIIEDWSGFADTSKLGYWHWSWSGSSGPKTSSAGPAASSTAGATASTSAPAPASPTRAAATDAGGSPRRARPPTCAGSFSGRSTTTPTAACTANEPHPYVGVWNDSSGWKVLSNAYPSGWGTSIDTGSQELVRGTRTAYVGIHAATAANLSCGRDYQLGGATLFLTDPENPTVSAPSGYPTGWVKSGQNFTISAPASDPGLGVDAATGIGPDGHAGKETGLQRTLFERLPRQLRLPVPDERRQLR